MRQSPNYDGCKEAHSQHIIIKMPKVKDKERLLKAARETKLVIRWLPDGREKGEKW